MFELFVLGRTPRENKRRVVLGDAVHEVKAVKFLIRGDKSWPFRFEEKNGVGVFSADPNGQWSAPITTDMTLASSSTKPVSNFIEVACKEHTDYVELRPKDLV